MNTADEIRERVEALSAPLQAEVLDFVEFLASKAKRQEEEDREDYERAVERLRNPGRRLTMSEVEQRLALGD